MTDESPCALLLLAAGGSQRLGEPKQLKAIEGEPLIRRAARTALAVRLAGGQPHPVVLVLGAHAERIRPHLQDLPIAFVENPLWSEGMASSLRAGLGRILEVKPQVRGVLVMLADQPLLEASHLEAILATQRSSGRDVIASHYGDHLGPPAYFAREHFPALQALRGDVGAKALLKSLNALPVPVSADAGEDLDTPEDYSRLLESARVKR